MKEFTKSYGINRVAELLEENERLKAENEELKQALEEIRKECKCYGRQTGSNREYDRDYGGELHINIIETINEVLKDE